VKKTMVFMNILIYGVLIIGSIVILFPAYITLVTAFKSFAMTARNFYSPPSTLFLENFRIVFRDANVLVFVRNSVFITCVSVFLILIFVPAVSYSISRRFQKAYYRILYYTIIAGVFVPSLVVLVPLVKMTSSLGMQNPLGMIPIYVGLAFSGNVFIAVGYMKTIPSEIDESAAIDGASVYTIFARIIYPMVRPITATIAILAALWIWNDFQLPLILLNRSRSYWTLPLFQFNFRNQYFIDYNATAAALTISMVPMMIFYILLQKNIISGLTRGALKG
jgi:raffinose/stachyose/melibiose transport system permease protein